MLADPRSQALIENFGGQWLQFRALESVKPDVNRFPNFDHYVRMSMQKETELFFANIIREDRPLTDFLDANYTFLNQRLAEFYGIKGVVGPEFRKVDLTGTSRGGIVTQGSILTGVVVFEPDVDCSARQVHPGEHIELSGAASAAECASAG